MDAFLGEMTRRIRELIHGRSLQTKQLSGFRSHITGQPTMNLPQALRDQGGNNIEAAGWSSRREWGAGRFMDDMKANGLSLHESIAALCVQIEQLDIGNMSNFFSDLLPEVNDRVVSEIRKNGFDLNNSEDQKLLEIMIETVRKKILEYKKLDRVPSSDLAVNMQTALRFSDTLKKFCHPLVGEMLIESEYWSREYGTRILDDLDLGTASKAVIHRIKSESLWGAVFLEAELNVLCSKIERNDMGGEEDLLNLLKELQTQKPKLEELGYWPFVVEMVQKLQTTNLKRLMGKTGIEVLRKDVDEFSKDSKARVSKAKLLRDKPRIDNIRQKMGLDNMDKVYAKMKPDEAAALAKYLNSTDGIEAREVLEHIFSVSDSEYLSSDYVTDDGEFDKVSRRVMNNPHVKSFVRAMLETFVIETEKDEVEPDYDLAFRLALLAACFEPEDLDPVHEQVVGFLNYQADMSQKLRSKHGAWFLCGASEHRLLQAMTVDASILLNSNFLYKFHGKKSALCLFTHNDEASGETFYEGVWYSVVDSRSKQELENKYNNGWMTCNVSGVEFAVMRPIKDDDDQSEVDAALLVAAGRNYRNRCLSLRKSPIKRVPVNKIVE